MLKVIGASFGRTGTSSARVALESLGFGPCHYMRALFTDPTQAQDWLAVAQGAVPDWPRILRGYRSTVAWPATYFWRELAAAYPAAKVLLIVRDPQDWYDSMYRTLYRTRPSDTTQLPVRDAAIERIVWQGTFGGRFTDRAHAIGVYREHLAEVRDTISADRLIELDVSQGWRTLCSALGVDEPPADFPVLNTTDEYLRRAGRAGALPVAQEPGLDKGERTWRPHRT